MKLEALFFCPKCLIQLKYNIENYKCNHCFSNYPILNGVPIFLTVERDTDVINKFWDDGWKNRFENTDHTFYDQENTED